MSDPLRPDPLRIAIAGLGTVGGGVIKILEENRELIAKRAGRPVEIVAVSSRDQSKDRGIDLSSYDWVADASDLAGDERIDVIVEMVGGSEGIAKELVEKALSNSKAVVTANKALVAHHGAALAALAEKHDAPLMYEAAVAGGIPIIKSVREGFAANDIRAIYGILNGTCNYILTTMQAEDRDFDDVLKDAQDKGFAEADPSFDIDGIDTAHKLCILTALGFGVQPDFDNIEIEGIRRISIDDIFYAEELGYRIKLLGAAQYAENRIVQSVSPCLVPIDSPMAAVDSAFNAVLVEGDFVGKGLAVGSGAGERPTASAVVADIIDLARGLKLPVFGVPSQFLKQAEWACTSDISGRFYIHLTVLDQPGVLADVSMILRDHKISMESVLQRRHNPDHPVSIVMTSHMTTQKAIHQAVEKIKALSVIVEKPVVMRIEEFS